MTKTKIVKWGTFILAVGLLAYAVYTFVTIKGACISSFCNDYFCTSDCGGSRSFFKAYVIGVADILVWASWLILLIGLKKSKKPKDKKTPKQKRKIRLYLLISSLVLLLLIGWGVLTKRGYIPNFLNIEFLCSEIPSTINSNYFDGHFTPAPAKPVIYLYPTETSDITVQLDYHGELIADYPRYDEQIRGWEVTAYPDGKLINHADEQEYSYLFWEGQQEGATKWDLSTGFVVKGSDTREFFQEKLSKMGLTPKEYNEFIVYWYPLMKDNPYNFIHFAGKEYTDTAPLKITPEPDSMLRVFMIYKPLTEKVEIPEQKLTPFNREGFTVIEWGGSEI